MSKKSTQTLSLHRGHPYPPRCLFKFFSLVVFICHFSAIANAQNPSCTKVFQNETRQFSRNAKSKFGHLQGSHWIRFRQDVVGFWKFYKSHLESHIAFQKFGLSRGDVHLENYDSLVKKDIHFVFDDLDHFGYGPFLGDFLRAASGTNLRYASLTPQKLFENYLLGLSGKVPQVSPELQKKIKSLDQEELRKKDIDDLTADGHFKKNDENIRRKDWSDKQKEIYEKLLSLLLERYPQLDVLDQIIYHKKNGGSVSQLRFRLFVKQLSDVRILEFKFLPETSALVNITKQPETELLLERLNFESQDLKSLSMIYEFNLHEQHIFLTRERRANLFEELELTQTEHLELAQAFIQELGYWQSQQSKSKEYIEILNRESTEIKERANTFVKAYLQRLLR